MNIHLFASHCVKCIIKKCYLFFYKQTKQKQRSNFEENNKHKNFFRGVVDVKNLTRQIPVDQKPWIIF